MTDRQKLSDEIMARILEIKECHRYMERMYETESDGYNGLLKSNKRWNDKMDSDLASYELMMEKINNAQKALREAEQSMAEAYGCITWGMYTAGGEEK